MKLLRLFFVFIFTAALFAKEMPTQVSQDQKIQTVLKEAYAKYKSLNDGKNADYIKALADVPSDLFGITIVTADGKVYKVGDSGYKFSIQSISKVFTAALVMQEYNPKTLQDKIGVSATGLPFNSILAIELEENRPSNPFVNAGAIATTSLVKAKDSDERWEKIHQNMNNFAATELKLNKTVYKSELSDNKRNQAISKLLEAYGRIYSDPLEATTVYTRQCSINISAKDLAVMGSTLANDGVNPFTHKKVLEKSYVPKLLSVMATAGLYDGAGDWFYATALPAKSGVGGGILVVVPHKMAIGLFSPRLDKIGNSVRGVKAAEYIIKKLHLNPYE